MGLFDDVLGAAGGLLQGQTGGDNSVMAAVLHIATDPQNGGVSGILQSLQSGGLGDAAKSWISTEVNQGISAEQIQSVLGETHVAQLADKLGIDPNQAASHLAEYLPQVINLLSPNGSLPANNDLLAEGIGLLKAKFLG